MSNEASTNDQLTVGSILLKEGRRSHSRWDRGLHHMQEWLAVTIVRITPKFVYLSDDPDQRRSRDNLRLHGYRLPGEDGAPTEPTDPAAFDAFMGKIKEARSASGATLTGLYTVDSLMKIANLDDAVMMARLIVAASDLFDAVRGGAGEVDREGIQAAIDHLKAVTPRS